MKLIIQNNSIAGTATDAYEGPDAFITAPDDFDANRMGEYVITDGVLSIAVPQQVTMRQARLALLGAGLLAGVDAAIDSLSEPDKSAAKIEWEYAAVVQRSSGLVPAMGTALGMTEAQLDALLVGAARL